MSKEVKELQKRWLAMMDTVHSNSHVVSFMNSRVGQYLDDHPFVALSLMVFIAASAVPIAFFLVFVVTTTVLACIGVIVMEGFVISLGGVTLLCILGGLSMLSLLVSGMLSVCYLSLTTLLSYWPIREMDFQTNQTSNDSALNISEWGPDFPPDNGDLSSMSYSTIIMSILFGIICLVGIVGNSLVICAVLKKSSPSSSVPDIFIVNLSLVDLLFLLGMPFLIHQLLGQGSWKFGGTMCTIITALDANSQFTSTYILTAMSIDRYLATVYPFSSTRFRKPPVAVTAICMLWALSFLSITPVWMYAQLIPLPGELLGCGIRLPDPQWDIYWYTLYQFFLAFAIPFAVITVAYQRILLKMARSSEALTRQRGIQLRIKRVTRIAIAICLAFFLCWAPFHVLQLVQLAVQPTLPFYYAYNVAISLGYANSCLNPFIYILLGQNFRRRITVSDQPAEVEGLFQHQVKSTPADPSESGQPLLHLVSVLAR